MQIYWRPKDIPELRAHTPAQRREVQRTCYLLYSLRFKLWLLWAAVFFTCALAFAGLVTTVSHFAFGFRLTGWPSLIGPALGCFIGGVARQKMLVDYLRPFYAR
jgi:hypothetical protein